MVERRRGDDPSADPERPTDPMGDRPRDRRPVSADETAAAEAGRRRAAEAAWRESEEKYRLVVERSEDVIYTHDVRGVFLSVNPALSRMTDYAPEEMVGRNLGDFLAEEDRAGLSRYLEAVVRDGQASGFLKILHRSGEERVLQYDCLLAREDGVDVVRGIAHDVQRRWAESALRVSVGRLEALLNNIPDLAWLKDEQGRFVAVNEPLARFVGRPREQILGRTDRELFETELAARFVESDSRALASDRSFHLVEEVRGEGGAVTVFDTTKTPVRDRAGARTGTAGIARDITERRRLEEQLFQSRKMEAVGRLAGGVAHDFNNLLTTILGYCGLLVDQLPPESPLRADVEEIQKAGDRAADLTRQLLAFGRKQPLEATLFDPNDLVRDVTRMIRALVADDVEIVADLDAQAGVVRADRGQIERVLINLAVNGGDAMPKGGVLTIRTRGLDPEDTPGTPEGGAGGTGWVLLSVADSGVGMDAETRRRVFEPFFTTKPRGTGLGLAISYAIVRQSGGDIWVDSESGVGTAFNVYLPRVEGGRAARRGERTPEASAGGNETILLVEDEESLRQLAVRVLAGAGYRVLAAGGPAEAVRLWRENGARADLLLADLNLPSVGGVLLAERLRCELPDLRVLFISGVADPGGSGSGARPTDSEFLQKPFTPAVLARRVREILDRPAGAARR